VQRRTEHRLYRAADGRWSLGVREWNGRAWSITQPVTSSLVPARRGSAGLRFEPFDETGSLPVPLASGTALRAIRVTVRAANARGVAVDSVLVTLPVGRP
jgi:hypothetical protein